MSEFLLHLRFIPVVLLLGAAAALLRRPGELPPALRGLAKLFGSSPQPPEGEVSVRKKLLAACCLVLALIITIL